jgi:hypothetical protein
MTTRDSHQVLYSENCNLTYLSKNAGIMKTVKHHFKKANITGLKRIEPTIGGGKRSPMLYFVFSDYEIRLSIELETDKIKLTLILYSMKNNEKYLNEVETIKPNILSLMKIIGFNEISKRETYFAMDTNKSLIILDKDIIL